MANGAVGRMGIRLYRMGSSSGAAHHSAAPAMPSNQPAKIGLGHRSVGEKMAGERGGEETATMKTILLVDDEFGIVEPLKDLLESEGFKVLCAANGKDALARLATVRPDLAIVDVLMPVMNGVEMLRAMRSNQEHQDVPVLLMSAVPRSVAMQGTESLPNHGWKFIRKPFDFADLLEAIAQMIGGGKEPSGGGNSTLH